MSSYKEVNHKGTTWYKDPEHTILHRIDGPAIERIKGDREWYLNGKRHRVGGPAIEYPDGISQQWFQYGLLHRENGPAEHWWDDKSSWYFKGKLHRLDGPAMTHNKGMRMWGLFGNKISGQAHAEFINKILQHVGVKDIKLIPYEILEELYLIRDEL